MKKLTAAAAIYLFAAGLVFADDGNFRIKPLREIQSQDLIEVKSDWLKCPKRIEASLRVASETLAETVFVRAYFYDARKNLIHTYKKPCSVWTSTNKGLESVGLPQILKNARDNDVYFALTDALEAKKWKFVLVVFGNEKNAVVRCKPQNAGSDFEFPEKAFAKFEN